MSKQEIEKTLNLIDKFFEGDTTLEEERQLYSLFNDKQIPAELEKYRDMFVDFGALPVQQQAKAAIGTVETISSSRKAVSYRPVIRHIAAIAASVVLIVTSVLIYNNYNEEKHLAALYGGSYVIENGKRIDDLRKIRPQIEQTLAEAKKIDINIDQSSFIRQAEREVLNSIGDDEQAEIEQLLNE